MVGALTCTHPLVVSLPVHIPWWCAHLYTSPGGVLTCTHPLVGALTCTHPLMVCLPVHIPWCPHLYTSPDGESHQAVLPLERQVVHLAVQLSHRDRLRVHHVRVHRLVEGVRVAGRVHALARRPQDLKPTQTLTLSVTLAGEITQQRNAASVKFEPL